MSPIVRGDLSEQHLGHAVCAACEAETLDELATDFLISLKAAMGATRIVLAQTGLDGSFGTIASDLPEADVRSYMEGYRDDDLVTDIYRRQNPSVVAVGRMIPLETYYRSRVYNDFYRPRDLDHLLGIRLTPHAYYTPGWVGLALFRSGGQPEYSESELQALSRALPAIEASIRRLSRATTRTASNATHPEPAATIALNRSGRLLWVSSMAEELLAPYLGARRELPDALIESAKALLEPQAFWRRVSDLRLSVRVDGAHGQPMDVDFSIRRRDDEPVVIGELRPVAADSSSPHALAARHGLTPTEGKILALIGAGLSNREVAARCFVTVATVKTHVHRILRKLGVSSRTQAALLVFGRQ